jgi:hypothetical protein
VELVTLTFLLSVAVVLDVVEDQENLVEVVLAQ